MSDENYRLASETYRDFLLFFGVLFFTCVVGIFTLLPEFEKIPYIPSWTWLIISALYFGLLVGIAYSIRKCFWILFVEVKDLGKFSFRYPELETLVKKYFKEPKYLEWLFIIVVVIIFILLYFIKIGLLE